MTPIAFKILIYGVTKIRNYHKLPINMLLGPLRLLREKKNVGLVTLFLKFIWAFLDLELVES